MSKRVLVIGNGFDLAHSLKTSYSDFIRMAEKYTCKSKFDNDNEKKFSIACRKNGFVKYFISRLDLQNWVDVEREIAIVIKKIENFMEGEVEITFKSNNRIVLRNDALLKDILCFFNIVCRDSVTTSDYSFVIEPRYYNNDYGFQMENIIKKMESELDEFIDIFEMYLQDIMVDELGEQDAIAQIASINPSYIVSFNYTDTYRIYNFDCNKVFHIHGEIGKNNIVLGMDDDDSTNLRFVAFKKYFQRIQKRTGFLDEEQFVNYSRVGKKPRDAVSHFYGHSLDATDGDVIRKIVEYSSKTNIYYRENEDDYKNQVKNLIEIFGKQEAVDMVQKGKIVFKAIEL